MTITLNGTTGVVAPEFDGPLDASNLTGALPAIDGSALTGIDTSPPTDLGAVGTYGLMQNLSGSSGLAGTTKAGSDLRFNYVYWVSSGITSAAGTWRIMGEFGGSGVNNAYAITVCVRIA